MNAKCCYSLLAAAELAKAFEEAAGPRTTAARSSGEGPSNGRPVRVKDLSARTGVPEGFLVQVLQSLRKAGVVESVRGAAGGYRLAAPPADIPVGRVLRAAEGSGEYVETSSFADATLEQGASEEMTRALGFVLSEAERALARAFDSITLATVRERVLGRRAAHDYQI